jgi:hypothetical protein
MPRFHCDPAFLNPVQRLLYSHGNITEPNEMELSHRFGGEAMLQLRTH